MKYLLKRYEVCLDPKLSLNPWFFKASNWRKGKYVGELVKLMDSISSYNVDAHKIDNVTCQIFIFNSAAERLAWHNASAVPHREVGRLMRQAQMTNDTGNLYFDFNEDIEDSAVPTPNAADIKRSQYNLALSPYSLGHQKDLLASALRAQFAPVEPPPPLSGDGIQLG